jgi:CBS domain-containing protein
MASACLSLWYQIPGQDTGSIQSNPVKEINMNTVRQLLKVKGEHVWTISKESTVFDGLEQMAEKQIGALVVIQDGQAIGIFTERDYARKVGPERKNPEETLIEEVMTRELITTGLNQTVNECMVLMTDNHIRHLPVMDEGQLVGMISVGDVVKDMIEELEFHVEQLKSYITGLR